MHAYVGERTQPPAQAGPRVRTHRLPLRRARRLRRVPRPPAPPHAHDRVAAAHAAPRLRRARRRSSRPASTARFDDAMERSAALYDALVEPFPEQAAYAVSLGVPDALRDADERARSDAPVRAAQLTARPPELPAHRAGDAPPDRRASRPPRDRRSDAATSTTATYDLERLDAERAAEARRVVRS